MKPLIRLAKPVISKVLGPRAQEVYPWMRWATTRAAALRTLGAIYQAHRIEFSRVGHAWCVPFELAGPKSDEVLIRTLVSAVSPGTETAFYGRQPNARAKFPYYPGYSMAGEIIEIGRNVRGLSPGQMVATVKPHASLAVVRETSVHALPEGVLPDEAAFLQLGTIAYHGVHRSQFTPGERVAVIGRGIIGQLVVQLVAARGAGELISIAPSSHRVLAVLGRYADRILVTNDAGRDELRDLNVDLTYEVSGSPAALNDAISATRDGGRVVLLGSPRGISRGFDWGTVAERNIRIIGAHISTLRRSDGDDAYNRRAVGNEFLQLIAGDKLGVRDLVTTEYSPWEAGHLYQALADRSVRCVGALLRWDMLAAADRAQRIPYWAGPNLAAVRGSKMKPFSSLEQTESDPRLLEGVPAEAPVSRGPRTPQRRLGVAIVGCGERGASNAAAAARARHAGLVAVMDVNEALARQLGERMGVAWTTDYASLLADHSVDAVFLNTPHFLHADQAIMAAQAGKHIVVEKPLATNLEDAYRVIHAAREHDVRLSTWLGKRYRPHVVRAKQLIDAGALGEVVGMHLAFHQYKPVTYWQHGGSGEGLDWRAQWRTSGGGVLIMNGIHFLDWLLYLSGLKVAEVSARYATRNSPAEVEDMIAMHLSFENGALATVNMATCVPGLRSPLIDLRIWGKEGQISLTPPYQFFSSRMVDGKVPERWHGLEPLPKMQHEDIEYLDRFAEAVLADKPLPIAAESGLALQAIIEAAYQSSREVRPVVVTY